MSQSVLIFESWKRSLLGISTAVVLAGCGEVTPVPESNADNLAETRLQIVTTILPVTQFTQAVAGDRAMVTQLLPAQVAPHDYQAKPQDAQQLAEADVLVKNGLGLEEFLEDLIENAENPALQIIDSSQGVALLDAAILQDNESHESHDSHAETDRPDAEGEESHDHGSQNPHIWLDPKRAMQQVANIREGLIAADPEGAPIYTANASAYLQQLQALDAELTALFQPYRGQTFVAFHDFAPYFAESYGLQASFLVDVPEVNPSPEDLQRVTQIVEQSNLKTLLTEPQTGSDSFEQLAQDLQIRVSLFDPLETGGADYLDQMRENARSLVTAFTGESPRSDN